MHTEHTLWPIDHRRNFVNIQIRGITGENRIRSDHIAKLFENFLFDSHILEHSFDNQILIRQVTVLGSACQQRHTLFYLLGGNTAFFSRGLIILSNNAKPFVQGVLVHL